MKSTETISNDAAEAAAPQSSEGWLGRGWPSVRDNIMQQHTVKLLSKKLAMAAESLQESARVVIEDITALKSKDDREELSEVVKRDLPEAPLNHPFAVLPWEREDLKGCMSDEEIRIAVKALLREVSKDPVLFEFPPPTEYAFVFDVWRQRFAATMLVNDSVLAKLRYSLVPRRMKEDDFWMMYLWRVESSLLPTLKDRLTEGLALDRQHHEVVDSQVREALATDRVNAFRKEVEREKEPPPPESEVDELEVNNKDMDVVVDEDELEEFEKMLQKDI